MLDEVEVLRGAARAAMEVGDDAASDVRRLMTAGIIDARTVVEVGVSITDASSRNRGQLVAVPSRPAVFVKHAGTRERAAYALLEAIPELRSLVPARLPGDGALLLEAEEGALDMWAHHTASPAVPAGLGAAVGAALGALHRRTSTAAHDLPSTGPVAALSAHRAEVSELAHLSPATLELIAVLQAEPAACDSLDALRRTWSTVAVIHGDVKWPNVLVVPPAADGRPAVRMIDWELAGPGDPAWDVGSAFAAYVSHWIRSLPSGRDDGDVAGLAGAAEVPIDEMHPAIRALWDAYLREATPPGPTHDLLARSVAMAAARLIWSAVEETAMRTRMGRRSALHVQVAVNVLADPPRAARRLFGIDDPAGAG